MLDHPTKISQAHPSNANAKRMNMKLDVNSWKLSYQLSTKGRSWKNESLFMRNNIIYNGFFFPNLFVENLQDLFAGGER